MLARNYVKGVNLFDQYQLKPFLDFMNNTTAGDNTAFLLTSDHGETKRIVNRENKFSVYRKPEKDSEEFYTTFKHMLAPDQEVIRVPGIFFNFRTDTSPVSNWNLTSLVDLAPTLIELMDLDCNVDDFSGSDLLEKSDDERKIYSEWSIAYGQEELEDDQLVPVPGVLSWQSVLTSSGYKYWHKGTEFEQKLLDNASLEEFFRHIEAKCIFRYLPDEELQKLISGFEDTRENRKQLANECLEYRYEEFPPEFYRWDQDHFEENNLLEGGNKSLTDKAKTLQQNLLNRFPDPLDIETPEIDTRQTEKSSEAVKESLKGLGYL
jgi:hypothetical protein